jgi:putative tricarboxylic transport membrane protein
MKKLNRISSIFLMAFSILICWASLKLGIGSLGNMGPGFMPLLVSIILFILSLLILVGVGGGVQDKEENSSLSWRNLLKPGSLVIALFVYIFLLESLGYIVTTFLLMSHMLFMSEPKKRSKNIFIAAIVAILTFAGFKGLQVQLPTGIFHIGW